MNFTTLPSEFGLLSNFCLPSPASNLIYHECIVILDVAMLGEGKADWFCRVMGLSASSCAQLGSFTPSHEAGAKRRHVLTKRRTRSFHSNSTLSQSSIIHQPSQTMANAIDADEPPNKRRKLRSSTQNRKSLNAQPSPTQSNYSDFKSEYVDHHWICGH